MTANFDFLKGQAQYALFAHACLEAERVLATSASMAAVGCRKALELAVKWVYAADNTITMPYKNNLSALVHEPSFKFAMDTSTWSKIPYIIKLGNLAVHTNQSVGRGDAVLALASLFEFVQWLDYCYGAHYEERCFNEDNIPQGKITIDETKIKAQNQLLEQKNTEIKALQAKVAALSDALTADKTKHQQTRVFTPMEFSEFATRKKYIDVDLKLLGWVLGVDAKEEVELYGMPNSQGKGYADYVLYGKDGLPLAVIEAKRTSQDPKIGTQQAKLYADCLQKSTGRRPLIFTTNGFETYLWDDLTAPQRQVSGILSKSDLEKLMQRRSTRKALNHITISDDITDRYYQKEAVRAVCDNIESGHRKSLLVMATGTGKTRTAASLNDVLSRGGYVTNTLFLADRTALVEQAKDAFKNLLPDLSLCNLLNNKDDLKARIVFSTYPTMLNTIDTAKGEDGVRVFTPAHFDLIIIDEAHRSIFKKYRAIFQYFDALLVGLTATPKTDVDRNTYDFFNLENGVPTYAYDYETAVEKDRVLVPYYNIEVKTKFLEQGIHYDQLSPEDKARYEEDFTDEAGDMPEFVLPSDLNQFIFNQATVDMVLEDLMTKGIKVAGGDRLGKTIIFAQNKNHAAYIVERFNMLYPQHRGGFARRVVHNDPYVHTIINDFKTADKNPHIAISVDMLDTGIDVPEIVNLVFFKRVRSKTKFWQMIGRGTRLCKNLFGPGQHKTHFVIFDYLGNFEFFRQHQAGLATSESISLTEAIFAKRVQLVKQLQQSDFTSEHYQNWRSELVVELLRQINALNPELVAVKAQLRHVEKYKNKDAFTCLTDTDQHHLIDGLASLVYMPDPDEAAKGFDNLMYSLMLQQIKGAAQFKNNGRRLIDICANLAQRATIPQIKDKLELINTVTTDDFWHSVDVLALEKIRVQLRDLIKFTWDEHQQNLVYTDLADDVLEIKEGEPMGIAYDFTDYRLRVNRYIEENLDNIAVYKLRHNIPLTTLDYQNLEHILTNDLGTKEDYRREFKDTPFGLLVRKTAKLDRATAQAAFSEFINDQSLSQAQIVFVQKIIDYVAQNGYIENIAELTKPPFDKPQSFVKLFDVHKQKQIVALIEKIKDNATKIVG